MIAAFYITFVFLILAELIKGLSANGTPPILQKFDCQLDLAYFMWANIAKSRVFFAGILVAITFAIPSGARLSVMIGSILLGTFWGGIYWLFNHYWVGKRKFCHSKNRFLFQVRAIRLMPMSR